MILQNLLMALSALRQNKLRSFLTMLGIIIGVSSVVTVIAIGAGVKNAVSEQVSSYGTNLIQVSPGQAVTGEEGEQQSFNIAASFGTSTLTEADVEAIRKIPGAKAVAPNTIVSGIPTAGDKKAEGAFILATTPEALDILNRKVQNGRFIAANDTNTIVLGANVAEKLFGSEDPLGKTVVIRNSNFTVSGVMEKEPEGSFDFGFTLDDVTYIPFSAGKAISGGIANIIEIDITAESPEAVGGLTSAIKQDLKTNHGGQEDFTVLTAEDQLKIFDQVLNILTSFVAAIAAISLFVGGIGVMNIMLVSVTERTREVGVRKAIGASNRQVLSQFLIEAVVLSLFGGLLGVAVAYAQAYVVKVVADISPVFNIEAFIIAISVSTVVGVVFGLTPAIKAARKRPIEALRYE